MVGLRAVDSKHCPQFLHSTNITTDLGTRYDSATRIFSTNLDLSLEPDLDSVGSSHNIHRMVSVASFVHSGLQPAAQSLDIKHHLAEYHICWPWQILGVIVTVCGTIRLIINTIKLIKTKKSAQQSGA